MSWTRSSRLRSPLAPRSRFVGSSTRWSISPSSARDRSGAMKYHHVISRRAVLRGGTIAIGLPFLESMIQSSAHAQTVNAPIGMLSLMYGLGTPDIFLDRGLAGTLQYYQSLI